MGLRHSAAVAATFAIWAFGASAAPAAVMIATYKGAVTSGLDETGLFGEPGSLAGESLSIFVTYDPELPGVQRTVFGGVESAAVDGSAPGEGLISEVRITLKGVTVAYQPNAFQLAYLGLGDPGQLRHSAAANQLVGRNYETSTVSVGVHGLAPPTLDDIGSFVSAGPYAAFSGGRFELTGFDIETRRETRNAYAEFTLSRVTIAHPSTGGVPEPETWALMLLGFGGLGGALRVRRSRRTASLAPATNILPAA